MLCKTWILNIPLKHVVIDELRITDLLEEEIIMDIVKWDEVTIIKCYYLTVITGKKDIKKGIMLK